MRAIAPAAVLLAQFLFFSPSLCEAGAPETPHVLLVSIDGLIPDSYVHADARGLKIPTLRWIMKHGAYSTGLKPVMPTVTYPSHTSMATGVNPGVHGIVTNAAWDPQGLTKGDWRWFSEDIKVPTIWGQATQKGLKAALISWPVTVGAAAAYLLPEFWRTAGPTNMQPDDLKALRALSTPGLLQETAAEFPDFYSQLSGVDQKDEALTDIALHLIETRQPDLLMLHLMEVDHFQHETGPWSPKAKNAIELDDHELSRIVDAAKKAGIWDDTILLVVSDHGFAAITKEFEPGVLLARQGLATLDAKGQVADWKASVISNSGSAYLYLKDPGDAKTRRSLLDLFGPLAGKPGSGVSRLIGKDQIAALGGDPAAEFALEAAAGFSFGAGYKGPLLRPSPILGTHGYFPDDPDMRPSLLAYGRGIGSGTVKNGALIDVGPTVASWLGLTLSQAQGRPLKLPAP